jgi:hypothetical protein
LSNKSLLGVDALARGKLLGGERTVAFKVQFGICQKGLIPCLISLRLMQLSLVGARINLRKEIAGTNVLALAEGDGLYLAVDSDADRHRIVGLDGPDTDAVDRKVLDLYNTCGDLNWTRARRRGRACSKVKMRPEQYVGRSIDGRRED